MINIQSENVQYILKNLKFLPYRWELDHLKDGYLYIKIKVPEQKFLNPLTEIPQMGYNSEKEYESSSPNLSQQKTNNK